ncbi:Maf family protein [Aestuariibius sp. 2305UL40-4]|uniref:Maf family protein n=1 Tax=Aestuariibius violaceus TaxID=3234132 RepID=UPI00345EDED9
MTPPLVLASGSAIRAQLLRNAGLEFEVLPVRIDEEAVRAAMVAEGAPGRDIADALAGMKARKAAEKAPGALVLGCDQVLESGGQVFGKAETRDEGRDQLRLLRGQRHSLLSAAVLVEDGREVWRHVGVARMAMRDFSDAYLDAYLDRTWEEVRHSVGCYQIEGEGVRLMGRVDGDYFSILGLPLVELLNYLSVRGVIAT